MIMARERISRERRFARNEETDEAIAAAPSVILSNTDPPPLSLSLPRTSNEFRTIVFIFFKNNT